MEGGGSRMIYWPRGRGLRRAWALKQGNRVIYHSKKNRNRNQFVLLSFGIDPLKKLAKFC